MFFICIGCERLTRSALQLFPMAAKSNPLPPAMMAAAAAIVADPNAIADAAAAVAADPEVVVSAIATATLAINAAIDAMNDASHQLPAAKKAMDDVTKRSDYYGRQAHEIGYFSMPDAKVAIARDHDIAMSITRNIVRSPEDAIERAKIISTLARHVVTLHARVARRTADNAKFDMDIAINNYHKLIAMSCMTRNMHKALETGRQILNATFGHNVIKYCRTNFSSVLVDRIAFLVAWKKRVENNTIGDRRIARAESHFHKAVMRGPHDSARPYALMSMKKATAYNHLQRYTMTRMVRNELASLEPTFFMCVYLAVKALSK
jgi:hypothetical protein